MEGNFTLYDNILLIRDVFSRREGGYGISYSGYSDDEYHFLLLETELKDKNFTIN